MVQHVVSWLIERPQRWARFDRASSLGSPTTGAADACAQGIDRALSFLAVAAVVLALGHYALAMSYSRAAISDFHPLNGDFQNFNPVQRLFHGERPGRDFDSYLGLGPVYLLYVSMLPFGSDFTTSLLAVHFLHAITTAAAIVLLCRLCGMPFFWSCLLGWFTLVYARNPAWFAGDVLHASLRELVLPGTSSLGLRCLPPLLAAPAMLLVLQRAKDIRLAGLCLGAIGGTLLPWSNDYGLATAASVLLVGGLGLWKQASSRRFLVQAIALMPLALTFAAAVVLLIATGGGVREWFDYNFLNVAKDQFWYFIAPNDKIVSLHEIPLYRGVLLAVICLPLLGWKIRRTGWQPADLVLLFLVLANLLAGYVSISGTRNERYLYPLYRCLVVVVPYLAWSGLWGLLHGRLAPALHEVLAQHGRQLTAATAGAVALFTVLTSQSQFVERGQRAAAAATFLSVPELGGKLNHRFNKVVALGREIRARAESAGVPEHRRLFSTYATAMDVVAGATHATRSDYVIHSLGPRRRVDYVRQFVESRPMFVSTIRHDFPWESWVRALNWDFYSQLLKDYQPTDRTFYNVVWERRSAPLAWPEISLPTSITQKRDSEVQLAVHFPPAALPGSSERHIVEVEIEYDWSFKPGRVRQGALRPYLFVHDDVRPNGWGLPHYERVRRFPIELAPGETHVISLAALPLDSTKFSLPRATARVLLPKSQIDGFELARLRSSSLCDENWTNGVWIRDARAAFYVTDATDLQGLRQGSRLRFRASGERVVANLPGEQVWLHGPPLDPVADGYPYPIEVVAR